MARTLAEALAEVDKTRNQQRAAPRQPAPPGPEKAPQNGGDGDVPALPTWLPIVGAVLAGIGIASLYFLLMLRTAIGPDNRILLNVLTALVVAASAAFLGGPAYVAGHIPLPLSIQARPVSFVLGGGVGVFFIVLLLMTLIP
jgi:hypothetical protein